MSVGIYYLYHGFGLKAFEERHIRIPDYPWTEGKPEALKNLYRSPGYKKEPIGPM